MFDVLNENTCNKEKKKMLNGFWTIKNICVDFDLESLNWSCEIRLHCMW